VIGSKNLILRLCLRVWRGREGKAKKEETSGKINKFGRKEVWRVNFSS
jgi:hypothetical protein